MFTNTIHGAATALRNKEATPVDLVRQCLGEIDRREAEIGAWVFIAREQALSDAERLTRELTAGRDRGPLHGIPIGVKDVFDVAGWPTAAGCPRGAVVAEADAIVVERLRGAGAIFLGKTVTTTFASFDPPATRNPFDHERTPGGSSSGSAAALVTGMCLGAIGSQTGGSLTRPASYCGVAACKPSYGLLPLDGVFPMARSLDHPGPMARCVRDLRLMLRAMAGPAWRDPVLGTGEQRLIRLRGLFDRLAEPGVLVAMDEVVERLRSRGVHVEETTLPLDEAVERHLTVMAVEAADYHRDRFARHPEDYPPKVRSLIERGFACSAAEYATCKQHQRDTTEALDAFFATNERTFLLTPATTGPAPLADTTGSPAFNSPWSYVGLPTVSLPTGQFVDGLPLAIQLVGPRLSEPELLDFAVSCETALRGQA